MLPSYHFCTTLTVFDSCLDHLCIPILAGSPAVKWYDEKGRWELKSVFLWLKNSCIIDRQLQLFFPWRNCIVGLDPVIITSETSGSLTEKLLVANFAKVKSQMPKCSLSEQKSLEAKLEAVQRHTKRRPWRWDCPNLNKLRFPVMSGWESGINICQIKYAKPSAVMILCEYGSWNKLHC